MIIVHTPLTKHLKLFKNISLVFVSLPHSCPSSKTFDPLSPITILFHLCTPSSVNFSSIVLILIPIVALMIVHFFLTNHKQRFYLPLSVGSFPGKWEEANILTQKGKASLTKNCHLTSFQLSISKIIDKGLVTKEQHRFQWRHSLAIYFVYQALNERKDVPIINTDNSVDHTLLEEALFLRLPTICPLLVVVLSK